MAICKNTEGSPGVADIGQVEEVPNNWNRMMQRHRTINDYFGCLIQENDKEKQIRDQFAFGSQVGTPDLKTSEQRPQTVG